VEDSTLSSENEDKKLPWWDVTPFLPAVGDRINDVLSGWASQIVLRDSLKDGGALHRVHVEGLYDGDLSDFSKIITELGGRVILSGMSFDPESSDGNADIFFAVWPDGYAHGNMDDRWLEMTLVSADPQLGVALGKATRGVLKKRGRAREVHVLVRDEEGYSLSSLGRHGMGLERGNYSSDVLAQYDHVLADLRRADPCGRVVVVEGIPGTGKTYLLRGLIQEAPNATFVLLPANVLESLTGPSVINAMVNFRRSSTGPIVFIMEDADAVLAPRAFDNMNSIDVILNLGDGILGGALDIRIIATTNTKVKQMDEAILRPGRLCRRLSVGALDEMTMHPLLIRLGLAYADKLGRAHMPPDVAQPRTLAEAYRLVRQRDEDDTPPSPQASVAKTMGFGSADGKK
jgi:hypothetical protein